MRLHFIHGWAFDASMWDALTPLLSDLPHSFADQGYFGETGETGDAQPSEAHITIAHSFGTMLALKANSPHCCGMVALNGFDRFAEGDGAAGIKPRVLDRMLTRFASAPEQVVGDFRENCGGRSALGTLNIDALQRDLTALRDMDCRKQAAQLSIPVLSLQGGKDPILPAKMRAQTLHSIANARHLNHAEAGHLLPAEQPDWCAQQIARFVQDAA